MTMLFFKHIASQHRFPILSPKHTLNPVVIFLLFWLSLFIFYDTLTGDCWTQKFICNPSQQTIQIDNPDKTLGHISLKGQTIEAIALATCQAKQKENVLTKFHAKTIFCTSPSIFSEFYHKIPIALHYTIPHIHFVYPTASKLSSTLLHPQNISGQSAEISREYTTNATPKLTPDQPAQRHLSFPAVFKNISSVNDSSLACVLFRKLPYNSLWVKLLNKLMNFLYKIGRLEIGEEMHFSSHSWNRTQQWFSQFTEVSQNTSMKSASLDKIKIQLQAFTESRTIEKNLQHSKEAQALRHHSQEFRRRIERITDNVYIGIGYGLANLVVIQGNSGLIVIDTLESPVAMREFMYDLKTFVSKLQDPNEEPTTVFWAQQDTDHHFEVPPFNHYNWSISCVIYTHFHSDHIFGASEIVIPGVTPVWAHEKTLVEIERVFGLVGGATYKRAMYQFGSFLSEDDGYLNAGIGKWLRYTATPMKNEALSLIKPTNTWTGTEKTLRIDGMTLNLIFAPGESPDQTVIWVPSKELLIGADNIYRAFPNIYAIRGTQSRDAMQWVHSLDRMRFLLPKYLLLGHTSPLKGKYKIWSTITAYRDAIQYVHDQTVRYMNKGYPTDKIVEIIRLPKHLQEHEFLQEYYGTVQWGIRAVFQHYIGWFSGRAEDLHPLTSEEKARFMEKLAGGRHVLLENSMKALQENHYQWSLELATHAQKLDPTCTTAHQLLILALKGLASKETSAPGRNWYLTAAKVEKEKWEEQNVISSLHHGNVKNKNVPISELLRVSTAQKKQSIDSMAHVDDIFNHFSVRTRDELLAEQDVVIGFHFTDIQAFTCWHVRRGIAYPRQTCERQTTFNVTTTDTAWRKLLKGEIGPLVAIARGHFRILGGRARDYWVLKQVMDAIETILE